MTTTGLKGTLDDAYTLAEQLRDLLNDAALADNRYQPIITDLLNLADTADDLSSRLSNLILQLRS